MIVLINDQLRRHLVVAMSRHVAGLRRNGLSVPPDLKELAAALGAPTTATDRHRPPPLDRSRDDLDGAPMPLTMTYADAGAMLGVSERSVQRLVSGGRLPAVSVLGSRRIRLDDIRAHVAALEPVNGTPGVEPGAQGSPSSTDGAPADPPGAGHSVRGSGSAAASTQERLR